MDLLQIRTMMKRNELMRVLDHMFRQERPKAPSGQEGHSDDDEDDDDDEACSQTKE